MLTAPDDEAPSDDLVDVEMLLAHHDQWLRVGEWEGLDPRWPWTVAVTAAAIMVLDVEATDAAPLSASRDSRSAFAGRGGNGGLMDLLAAGLLHAWERFIWDRPGRGARHTARVHPTAPWSSKCSTSHGSYSGVLSALK